MDEYQLFKNYINSMDRTVIEYERDGEQHVALLVDGVMHGITEPYVGTFEFDD